ncbi:MAG: helix-turn-helix domain-containing protein [Clostridia bacterium]|nr:helix-turn-helix domain-containing protein [Clostridia bacterium]
MEKYQSFDFIKKHDIQNFRGLQNETISHFHNPSGKLYPFYLSCFGITYPTPDYRIKRYPVRGFILEHVVSGKGYIILNGNKYTVTAGDTYLLKSGENCDYFSDEKEPYQKLWVNFSGSFPQQILSLYRLNETVYHGVSLSDVFEKLYALDQISTDISDVHLQAATLLTEMLLRLAKSIEKKEQISKTAMEVRHELTLHMNQPYNLDEMSRKLFLSKSEIIRCFKNAYDVTPYQFLLDLKINYAKTMLENGHSSIKEISEHLGFSSPYHFSETFKRRVGLSPLQYRTHARNA